MVFLLRRAGKFDLTRRKAFLIGFFLCVDVLFLPEFLQKGLIWAWLFLTCVLIAFSALWQRWRFDQYFAKPGAVGTALDTSAADDLPGHVQSLSDSGIQEFYEIPAEGLESVSEEILEGVTEQIPGNTEEDPGNTEEDPGNTEEDPGNTEEDPENTEEDPGSVEGDLGHIEEEPGNLEANLGNTEESLGNVEEDIGDIPDVSVLAEGRDALLSPKVLNLEQLLDLGFAAKSEGRYGLAAEWFEKALDLNPAPDLAVSLLIDVFWLRQIAVGRENAAQEFRAFWLDHQSLVPPGSQFRRRLLDWMDKQSFAAGYYIK